MCILWFVVVCGLVDLDASLLVVVWVLLRLSRLCLLLVVFVVC